MSAIAGNLLQNIHYPQDLRKVKPDALPQLSKELRQYIIDVISDRREENIQTYSLTQIVN